MSKTDKLKIAQAERAKSTFAHLDEIGLVVKASMISNMQDTVSGVLGDRTRRELHRQLNSFDTVIDILKREIDTGKIALKMQKKANKSKGGQS